MKRNRADAACRRPSASRGVPRGGGRTCLCPGELLVEDVLVVLQRRIEKLVERTVVTEGQGEKPRLDFVRDRACLVELRHIEEIPRMLPIQRRAKLPAIQLRTGKDIDFGLAEECLRSRACG